jgi:hypothetical protein
MSAVKNLRGSRVGWRTIALTALSLSAGAITLASPTLALGADAQEIGAEEYQALTESMPKLLATNGPGSEIVAETSTPMVHTSAPTTSDTAGPDEPVLCSPVTSLNYPPAFAAMSTLCNTPWPQAIQVCVQQKYEAEWHSNNTCKRNPESGVIDTESLAEASRGDQCVSGRYYRAWGWYYTPGLAPETSVEYIPSVSGGKLC